LSAQGNGKKNSANYSTNHSCAVFNSNYCTTEIAEKWIGTIASRYINNITVCAFTRVYLQYMWESAGGRERENRKRIGKGERGERGKEEEGWIRE
jgi:hypothetical protein